MSSLSANNNEANTTIALGLQQVFEKYTYEGGSMRIGSTLHADTVYPDGNVRLPLSMITRHGLVSGATGTGKTKTVQVLIEELSLAGVPSIVMDVKGDLSGLGQPGDEANRHIQKRHDKLGYAYTAQGFPIERWSVGGRTPETLQLKATITELGPQLTSQILGLNETQKQVLELLFIWSDSKRLPIIDVDDLVSVLHYASSDEGLEELTQQLGGVQRSTLQVMLRAAMVFAQKGGNTYFGEPSLMIEDLIQTDEQGQGVINIMSCEDLYENSAVYSAFMLSFLAECMSVLPEQGDEEKPRLVIVIDEAHLLFEDATTALMKQITRTVKLIRSKGVGLWFCTQLPNDIPSEVLSQLGTKVQHGLRGFTEKDRRAIKTASENYPISDLYDISTEVMELGIGEAFITTLNEKGVPTPLVKAYLQAPRSRMDVLTPEEQSAVYAKSRLKRIYGVDINPHSAHEILAEKLGAKIHNQKAQGTTPNSQTKVEKKSEKEPGLFNEILTSNAASSIAKEAGNHLVRGIFGYLGIKIDGRRTFF